MSEKNKADNLSNLLNDIIKNAGNAVNEATAMVGNTVNSTASKLGETVTDAAKVVTESVNDVAGKASDLVVKGKDSVVNVIDANGSGNIDLEDFIILGLKSPGVSIDRTSFLRTELKKNYPENVVEDAIAFTPAHAGIPVEAVNKIADGVIAYERSCVSGISTALGIPGGVAMAATIPTDIAQYYGFMLRAAQKLLYLYGFPEIDTSEKNHVFDSETLNMLTLCLGVMYGVAGANKALLAMANALARGVEKQLLKTALTKGTIYPIVKNIAKWFGQKMTKQVFAGFFKKAIPVVGGVIGGSITFLSFKPCCDKLKESLNNTLLSNPNGCTIETEMVIDEELIDTSDDIENNTEK